MIDGAAFKEDLRKLAVQLYADASEAMQQCVREAERSAKTTSLFRNRTGLLQSRIAGSTSSNKSSITGTLIAGTKYAEYVENGQPRHMITGNPNLRFVMNGVVMYRRWVDHPGAAARPFMQRAQSWGEKVLDDALYAYINHSIERFNT